MKIRWSSNLARPNETDRRKKLRSRHGGETQWGNAGGTSGLMFFHAYCIGAIEKYCAVHGENPRLDSEEDD